MWPLLMINDLGKLTRHPSLNFREDRKLPLKLARRVFGVSNNRKEPEGPQGLHRDCP